jgi:hypothetical protein
MVECWPAQARLDRIELGTLQNHIKKFGETALMRSGLGQGIMGKENSQHSILPVFQIEYID